MNKSYQAQHHGTVTQGVQMNNEERLHSEKNAWFRGCGKRQNSIDKLVEVDFNFFKVLFCFGTVTKEVNQQTETYSNMQQPNWELIVWTAQNQINSKQSQTC